LGLAADIQDEKGYLAEMDVFPLLAQINTNLSADKRDALKTQLAVYLNELLLHDFHSMVQLLYRVDVSEKKLKTVLEENPGEDAGNLLADLVMQRQLEKQVTKSRFQFPNDASEEERW
jgi:hypothetical protein